MPILGASAVFAAVTNATATAGNATSGGAAGAQAKPAGISDSDLVFDIDLVLLGCVAVFFLLLLPRAAVRFTHKREWIDGHFLRSVYLEGPTAPARVLRRPSEKRPNVISPVSPVYLAPSSNNTDGSSYEHHQYYTEEWGGTTDVSHTYVSHADLLRKGSTASGRERRRQNAPTHMPGVSTMFPATAAFLRKTIRPGLTIGKSIILVSYSAIMLFAGLYMSNPLSEPVRAGFVAVSQVPVIVILGSKNNLVGMLIGFGYERLNYFHRFAGRMFILAANVHAIGYFYSWSIDGTFAKSIMIPKFTNGLVALICADLILLLSTDFVRQRFYNSIFIPSHVVLAVIMCVTLAMHYPICVPYVVVAAAVYGLDRFMRLIKSRVVMARLRPLPDLGMTRVEIPGLNSGWRAGQHVRLRVLSFGMGWRRWAETHPFTIASVSRCPSGEGLVLMVKKAGDWTNKLYDLAQRADYSEANGLGGAVQVIVEGPYGGPGHAIFSSFSGALFVAGGSGITFALAAVQDLMKKDLEYRSRVRAMELVWCIQDPSALTPLIPLFSTLVAQSQEAYASLRISVYYTRAPPNPEVLKTFSHLPPGLTLSPARPKLGKNLKGVVDRASALFSGGKERSRGHGSLTGVVVGVCGPSGLGDEVRKAVANFDPDNRKRVGGIELHEEAFGW
ncbi:incomplete iron reductase [Lentinus tigrinus ALCF2SS1-7]|uniref:ferric-chelate reductase (NADPH) n=1 Tax=Lentinus tigrinus ALCF2SS1-6 TaxID=1328759 RepID=A0A5C2RZN1_9APHY|nr:incomplete iron reductase [Lentinus tigrinus ALCF2SS1-6]RPD79555.1 incomplete iron reductase [Lentinus tigrinus ALCF2SS1-7]